MFIFCALSIIPPVQQCLKPEEIATQHSERISNRKLGAYKTGKQLKSTSPKGIANLSIKRAAASGFTGAFSKEIHLKEGKITSVAEILDQVVI